MNYTYKLSSKFSSTHFLSTPLSNLQVLTWGLTTGRCSLRSSGETSGEIQLALTNGTATFHQHRADPPCSLPGHREPVTGHWVSAKREAAQLRLAGQVIQMCDASKEPASSWVPVWWHPHPSSGLSTSIPKVAYNKAKATHISWCGDRPSGQALSFSRPSDGHPDFSRFQREGIYFSRPIKEIPSAMRHRKSGTFGNHSIQGGKKYDSKGKKKKRWYLCSVCWVLYSSHFITPSWHHRTWLYR